MSDFNEVYNINICKDKCDFKCTSTEYSPNGFSYYKCSKCENTFMEKNNTSTNDNYLNYLQNFTSIRKDVSTLRKDVSTLRKDVFNVL